MSPCHGRLFSCFSILQQNANTWVLRVFQSQRAPNNYYMISYSSNCVEYIEMYPTNREIIRDPTTTILLFCRSFARFSAGVQFLEILFCYFPTFSRVSRGVKGGTETLPSVVVPWSFIFGDNFFQHLRHKSKL